MESASIDRSEIAKFEAMAEEWWNETGKFKPLHKFNPVRIEYIRNTAIEHFKTISSPSTEHRPLDSLSVLDIGCGGGLLCEPLTHLGATVTGIDASEKNINIATLHAEQESLDITYTCTSAEEFAEQKTERGYDIVLAMEIIEHVADVESFVTACCQLVKPGGLLFIATLNRTAKSYAFAIVGAEYVLRWLPQGTHDWKKFLRPSEIERIVSKNHLTITDLQGVSFNPLRDLWQLSKDVNVNYMVVFTRPNRS